MIKLNLFWLYSLILFGTIPNAYANNSILNEELIIAESENRYQCVRKTITYIDGGSETRAFIEPDLPGSTYRNNGNGDVFCLVPISAGSCVKYRSFRFFTDWTDCPKDQPISVNSQGYIVTDRNTGMRYLRFGHGIEFILEP